MATLTITNLSTSAVYLSDLYTSLSAGASLTATRAASDIPRMAELIALISAGTLSLAVTYSADELATGLMSPPNAVESQDIRAVAATDMSPLTVLRVPFSAGAPGTADDVTIFAVNHLPFKMRVVDSFVQLTTAIGASTAALRTRAGGLGTLLGTYDTGTSGRAANTSPVVSVTATPGSSDGLFFRRTNRGIAGELVIYLRQET